MPTVVDYVRRATPRPVKAGIRSSLLKLNRLAGIPVQAAVAPPNGGAVSVDVGPGDGSEATPSAAADPSQHGEVTVLKRLLRDNFPRAIVDVGAYDGVTLSNSLPFVSDGWTALLVEPHPVQFARLSGRYEGREWVHCVNKACSDAPGTLPMFLGMDGPDSMNGTLCTDDNPWFQSTRSDDSIEVEVDTLTHMLAASDFPMDFSILLVDGEGMDYEILKGLDFDRYRPRLLLTEEYISNPEKHNAKYRLLLDRGYTFHSMVGCNTLWIANEWIRTCLGL